MEFAQSTRNNRKRSRSGQQIHSKPLVFSDVVETDDKPGEVQFTALLGQVSSYRNKWAYCSELNKLYIMLHQVVPVEFRWKHTLTDQNVVVRAMPIFSEPQHFKDPVSRCFIHMDPLDPVNEGVDYVKHIIRSDNPGAFYEENENTKRCSVIVPLGHPQPGTGTVTVTYKFMCKTSCVLGGVSRQPMAVIFTLERFNGEVLGRQTMGVKVCSCPRRDMEKEQDLLRRKVKQEKCENFIGYRLQICLPDLDMFRKVLEFNHAAVTSLMRSIPPADPRYVELSDFLNTLEDKLSYLQIN